jgi:hypothetical protein
VPTLVLPDSDLEGLSQFDAENVDTEGMPDYDRMSTGELQSEMDKFGMKKNVDPDTCREVLKEVWLYQHRGVFPKFLSQFM